jgi:uncharacterized protein YciI
MKYFALLYDVVDGFIEKRAPHRPAHLQMIREAHARGEVVLAGALGDPPDGALIVFRADTADVVERFAKADPYVTNGLVRSWRVRPWAVVIGNAT